MSETTKKQRAPYALIVSIAINGLLAGLVIGMALAGPPQAPDRAGGGPRQPPERMLAEGVLRAAPIAERREIRRELRQAWMQTQSNREELRAFRGQLADVLAADPYDPAALDALLANMRAAELAMKETVQSALADALSKLPPERRSILSEAIRNGDMPRRARRDRN